MCNQNSKKLSTVHSGVHLLGSTLTQAKGSAVNLYSCSLILSCRAKASFG